jgi:hypothetical protein
MQTKPERITPVFGPETQFNTRIIVVHAQSDLVELQEPHTTSLLLPSSPRIIEQKGVPFSALHD